MSGHARIFPPSSAQRRVACPGSAVMELDKASPTSSYSASGTATHQLAEWCLTQNLDAVAFLGKIIDVEGFDNEVTRERAERAQFYVDYVRDLVKATNATLFVEQKLSIEHLTGEKGAKGTSDSVLVSAKELCIVDLKDGQKPVDAEGNLQLTMYALAALEQHELVNDFETVRMVIVQPRLNKINEWTLPVDTLCTVWQSKILAAAADVKTALEPGVDVADFLHPGEEQCAFCKAKPTCPALRGSIKHIVLGNVNVDDFEDLTAGKSITPRNCDADVIASLMPHVDLIETWVKAVRARGEELLHAGVDLAGYKLVEGKKGGRKWINVGEVEAEFKKMRLKLDEMYDRSVISPTRAEKLLARENPRRWAALQKFITQSGGNPTVVPVSDNRPAILKTSPTAEFDDLTIAEYASNLV